MLHFEEHISHLLFTGRHTKKGVLLGCMEDVILLGLIKKNIPSLKP
jgi:hypothetical protein